MPSSYSAVTFPSGSAKEINGSVVLQGALCSGSRELGRGMLTIEASRVEALVSTCSNILMRASHSSGGALNISTASGVVKRQPLQLSATQIVH